MKRKITISCVCVFAGLALCIGAFWCLQPMRHKFKDRFIMRKHKARTLHKHI